MSNVLMVGIGGFLGASSRYLSSKLINKHWKKSFPMATFIINVLGSFILGLVVTHPVSNNTLQNEIKYFISIGFLGSFTTFSTFEFEALQLVENKKPAIAGLYVLLSFSLGLFFAWLAANYI